MINLRDSDLTLRGPTRSKRKEEKKRKEMKKRKERKWRAWWKRGLGRGKHSHTESWPSFNALPLRSLSHIYDLISIIFKCEMRAERPSERSKQSLLKSYLGGEVLGQWSRWGCEPGTMQDWAFSHPHPSPSESLDPEQHKGHVAQLPHPPRTREATESTRSAHRR